VGELLFRGEEGQVRNRVIPTQDSCAKYTISFEAPAIYTGHVSVLVLIGVVFQNLDHDCDCPKRHTTSRSSLYTHILYKTKNSIVVSLDGISVMTWSPASPRTA